MNKTFSSSVVTKSQSVITPKLTPEDELEDSVEDRQSKIPGFQQTTIQKLDVVMVGAGGLGSEICEGLVRKGVHSISVFDHDAVELSNLNRQKFHKEDLYKNKAHSLIKNLKNEGAMGTVLTSYGKRFQEAEKNELDGDVLICGVDNDPTRVKVAKHALEKEIPAVFTAVSRDADHGYVMIQKPGEACWGCAFSESVKNREEPCPGTPAVKDILKLMGAVVLYAVDSIFMDRKITWNYRDIYLSDPEFNMAGTVKRKEDCPICG